MKYMLLISILFSSFNSLRAQTNSPNDWDKIYSPQIYSGSDYVSLIEKIKFTPIQNFKNYSLRSLEEEILKLDPGDLQQMNIDGNYYCSVKHDDLFQLWNLNYPKLTKFFWDYNCKGLIVLMILDGTFKRS